MAVFKHGNEELADLSREPSVSRLIAYFEARISEWPHCMIHGEGFTVDTFYDFRDNPIADSSTANDLLAGLRSLDAESLPDKHLLRWLDLLAIVCEQAEVRDVPEWLRELATYGLDVLKRSDSEYAPQYTAWAGWAKASE